MNWISYLCVLTYIGNFYGGIVTSQEAMTNKDGNSWCCIIIITAGKRRCSKHGQMTC